MKNQTANTSHQSERAKWIAVVADQTACLRSDVTRAFSRILNLATYDLISKDRLLCAFEDVSQFFEDTNDRTNHQDSKIPEGSQPKHTPAFSGVLDPASNNLISEKHLSRAL